MKLLYFLFGVVTAKLVVRSHGSELPKWHTRGISENGENSNIYGREILAVQEYTLDADFSLGTMINVNHDEIHDQIQLDKASRPFDFLWVAASGRGTVVKIDANTGTILGEYKSSPSNHPNGNPSRTTVDRDGSVWLTNRADVHGGYGSIVHIGLLENNQCEDRNGNGIIETSTGLSDIKKWVNDTGVRGVATADDECIVHYTKVNSRGARHVSITSSNDVWVSGSGLRNFDLVKGGKYDVPGSGTIVRSETSVGYGGYGGLIDSNGVIWSSRPLLRWDTAKSLTGANGDPSGQSIGPPTIGKNWAGQGGDSYGLCIDSMGNVWDTQLYGNRIAKYKPDGTFIGAYEHGAENAQGCVVGLNDDVYVAHALFGATTIGHLKNDGRKVGNIPLTGTDGYRSGNGPTGVAVDRNGKIWVTNIDSNTVSRIDPTLGAVWVDGTTHVGQVDKTVDLGSGASPYNYSDMTGRNLIQPPTSGTWVITYIGSNWHSLVWNANVPSGTSLTVSVCSSIDGVSWTSCETAQNGKGLGLARGGFLQINVSFERPAGFAVSPVLYDLSVKQPTPSPSAEPSYEPTSSPSEAPSHEPTSSPSGVPSYDPTSSPSEAPSHEPTSSPSGVPSYDPTSLPSEAPSHGPTFSPSAVPSYEPTFSPSAEPTYEPTSLPTVKPSHKPTSSPTKLPTKQPTNNPAQCFDFDTFGVNAACVANCGNNCQQVCDYFDIPFVSRKQCNNAGSIKNKAGVTIVGNKVCKANNPENPPKKWLCCKCDKHLS